MNIGIDVNMPKNVCKDKHCVFHGNLSIRGRVFKGKVLRTNRRRTISVEMVRMSYIPKYERYERKRKRLNVHIPDCINVKVGDVVRVIECRPISKTKNFTLVEVLR